MKQGKVSPGLERAFEWLREVPPPDSQRQEASRAAFLNLARYQQELAAPGGGPMHRRRRGNVSWMPFRLGRLATVGVLLAVVLVLVAGTGGIVYAADAALPGDPLYGIDQAVESAQLSLTSKPRATLDLLLSFADERLQEAEKLSAQQDEENLETALKGYGSTISLLAQALGRAERVDAAALAARVDQSFAAHEDRMATIFQNAGENEEEDRAGEEDESAGCAGADPHPVAVRLAERYGASSDQVMSWFCDGYGFGEIVHALGTGSETGALAGDLLAQKTALGGWGRVWQELGLIGPRKDVPRGPAADEPGGPPDDRPIGPPADKPGGPPDDRPVGPPADRPGRPPDDRPIGPPADKPGKSPDDEQDEGETEEQEGDERDGCVGADPHPVGEDLAESYDVSYEDIMDWFCVGGYGFGDIRLALEASEEAGVPAGELLARKTELGGWGQVWQELGLSGKPEDEPAGPPYDAGSHDGTGPPESKPGGRP